MNAYERGCIVDVLSGRYTHCRLSYVGLDRLGWHVCLNSNEVGGYVRIRRVSFVRPAAIFDPAIHDRMMHDDFLARLAFAARVTGAQIQGSPTSAD